MMILVYNLIKFNHFSSISQISPNNDPPLNESSLKSDRRDFKLICFIPCISKEIDVMIEIKRGWGSECDELIFFSDFDNVTLNSIDISHEMKLGRKEVYEDLAIKVWHCWRLIFERFKDQKNTFFLKADTDTYMIMRNYIPYLKNFKP
jgi:hypothetical protein